MYCDSNNAGIDEDKDLDKLSVSDGMFSRRSGGDCKPKQ